MEDMDPNEVGSPEEASSGQSRRLRFVVVALVVVLALGYMIYAAFPGNALFYLSVAEFMDKQEAQDGRVVRVSGKLVEGSYQRKGQTTLSRFQLTDSETTKAMERLEASYEGVIPDLFFNPHSEIILQGSYGPSRVFQADTILVKCPSKFRSLQEELEQSG